MSISAPEVPLTNRERGDHVTTGAFPEVLHSLHGLRGWMAMIVLTSHAIGESGGNWMARLTSMAVFVFFVLSGFILSHVYRPKLFSNFNAEAFLRFLRNRAARILPLYFATTFAAFALVLLARHLGRDFSIKWDTSIQNLMINLFALDIWQRNEPGVGYAFPFVRWSVTVEIWMYALVFPLFPFAYKRLGGNLTRIGSAIIATLFVYFLLLAAIPATFPLEALLVRGIPYFVLGFLIYCIGPRRLPGWVEWLLWAAVVAGFFATWKSLLIVSSLIIFALANGSPRNPLVRFLAAPLSVFLGDISYSIYLWHGVFGLGIDTSKRAIGKYVESAAGQNLICFALLLTVSIVVSVLSYRFFEIPLQKVIRGKRAPRPAGVPS